MGQLSSPSGSREEWPLWQFSINTGTPDALNISESNDTFFSAPQLSSLMEVKPKS